MFGKNTLYKYYYLASGKRRTVKGLFLAKMNFLTLKQVDEDYFISCLTFRHLPFAICQIVTKD